MRNIKLLPLAAAALMSLFAMAPSTANAQQPIMYHTALADLRTARYFLQQDHRPQYAQRESKAIEEMSKAIDDISKVVINDGGKPWQQPPPQAGADPGTPIHSAFKLLNEAHEDVGRGTDVPPNQGLQVRALRHIDEALNQLRPLQ
jgi:hypothetical protein